MFADGGACVLAASETNRWRPCYWCQRTSVEHQYKAMVMLNGLPVIWVHQSMSVLKKLLTVVLVVYSKPLCGRSLSSPWVTVSAAPTIKLWPEPWSQCSAFPAHVQVWFDIQQLPHQGWSSYDTILHLLTAHIEHSKRQVCKQPKISWNALLQYTVHRHSTVMCMLPVSKTDV